ncbi:MAG: sulfatase, partial [Mailhella sp.]|nr:sulfatase [Mailhella sp.]
MKNAIVIMFDSLQWDYLGCYGNEWIKTPNMDRLAREGVLFENAYTEGLPTVPCRRAMHTGRFTLPRSGWSPLTMEDTTIADLCWGRPIDTVLIFDCPMYRQPKFGYTRGFDKVWFTHGHEADDYYFENDPLYHESYDDYMEEDVRRNYVAKYGEIMASSLDKETINYLREMQYWKGPEDRFVAKTVRKAIEYLKQVDRNKQFFLWIDSFDPHEPWNPPSVYMHEPCPYDPDYTGKNMFVPYPEEVAGLYTEEQLHHVRMLYAELVTLCDTYLGVLMDAVRRLGFEEDTLFMMVSDHGEPLGNGKHGHGLMRKVRPWPYQELVRVPMLLRAPRVAAGQRIKAYVQSVDVAPTVCDWLGIGVHPAMQGKSLLPLVSGEVEKVRDFAIAGYNKYSWSLYNDDWSYIHWLHPEQLHTMEMAGTFYTESVDGSHLKALGGHGGLSEEA